MYRTTKLPILLLIFSATTCMARQTAQEHSFAHGFFNTGPMLGNEKTAICIINDSGEGPYWNSAVKNEFIKLTMDKAPHIFATPDIINSFQQLKQSCFQALAGFTIVNPFKDLVVKNGTIVNIAGQNISPFQYQYLIKDII